MAQRRRIPITFKGLSNSVVANRIPIGNCFSMENCAVDLETLSLGPRDAIIGQRIGVPSMDSANFDLCWGLGYGNFTTNTTVELAITGGTPSSGACEVLFAGQNASIPWDATVSAAQALISAMSCFNPGEATVGGGPYPFQPLTVTLSGRYAGIAQSNWTVGTNSFNNSATVTPSIEVAGGPNECYLVVIQETVGSGQAATATLWKVTSADGFMSTTWTQVATGLEASDWRFTQFEDKVYAINATSGIAWFQLGGGWSAPAGISGYTQDPNLGLEVFPYQTYNNAFDTFQFSMASGWNFTSSGFASSPTVSWTNQVKIVLNADDNGTTGTIIFTKASGSVDLSAQDHWAVLFTTVPADITIDPGTVTMTMTNADMSPVTVDPDFISGGIADAGTGLATYIRRFYFGETTETDRTNVNVITLTFNMPLAKNAGIFNIKLIPQDVWMNDTMTSLDINDGPTSAQIAYSYTYSNLSPPAETNLIANIFVTPALPINNINQNVPTASFTGMAVRLTAQDQSFDLLNFYRRDSFNIWRRIASLAANGAGTFTDTLMADEILGYGEYGLVSLPGAYLPNVIAYWKGSLVIGSGPLAFISYQGIPTEFAPSPDEFGATSGLDPTDPENPRTVYMSVNRSEPIYCIVGQDPVYMAGPRRVYAMVNGTTPLTLSPPLPMPGSRGCFGFGAMCAQSEGVLAFASTGIWYYAASPWFDGSLSSNTSTEEEVTKEIRGSVQTFALGGTGLNGQFSGATNTVLVYWNEEVWAFNPLDFAASSAGTLYLHRSRNGHWESGITHHSVKAAIGDQYNGLILATGTGALARMGGVGADPASWTWTSGIMDMERCKLTGILAMYTGQPEIKVQFWDTNGTQAKPQILDTQDGKIWHIPNIAASTQGFRMQITVSSATGTDVVNRLELEVEDLPPAYGN